MKNKNIESSSEYQAYIERISAPPCPQKITAEELQNLKKKRKNSKTA